jgi:hypothetical protein
MKTKKRGRKPVQDPKQPVNLFVRKSVIDSFGGSDELKEILTNFITIKTSNNGNNSLHYGKHRDDIPDLSLL